MAEENKSGDLALDPVQLPNSGTMASGSYREAVHKDYLQDKASRILKENLSRQFSVNLSALSVDEISARQQRSNSSRLTAAEESEKSVILSGVVELAQLSQAQWALFSTEELKFLSNTRYRDSIRRHKYDKSFYICEQRVGDFAYLFPSEEAVMRHQDKITTTVWEAWKSLIPSSEIKTVDELILKVNLQKVTTHPGRSVPGLQITLRGPQKALCYFFDRLDATPYVGHWNFPTHSVSLSLFHAPRPSVFLVRAHLSAQEVSGEEAAVAMRLRLQGTEASLRSFSVPIFKPLVDFELECFALPPSLVQSPVLEITPDIKIPISFPGGPASCGSCFKRDHVLRDCPSRPPPPCDRPCGICEKVGHFGMKCPTLRKPRECFFCYSPSHLLANCPRLECRYCHVVGHRARDCEEAAKARITRAARVVRATASTGAASVVQPARGPAQPSSARQGRTASSGATAPTVAASLARAAPIAGATAAPAAAPTLSAATTSLASAAAAPPPRASAIPPLAPVIDLSSSDAAAGSAPVTVAVADTAVALVADPADAALTGGAAFLDVVAVAGPLAPPVDAVVPPTRSSASAASCVASAAAPSAPADPSSSTTAGADTVARVFGPARPSTAATNKPSSAPALSARSTPARASKVPVESVASTGADDNIGPWSTGLGAAQEYSDCDDDNDYLAIQAHIDAQHSMESESDTATSNASIASGKGKGGRSSKRTGASSRSQGDSQSRRDKTAAQPFVQPKGPT